MKCSLCPNISVWYDYAPANYHTKPTLEGLQIGLCYACLVFVGFTNEALNILPQLSKCKECGSLFKKKNTDKCALCWKAYFTQKQPTTLQITQTINDPTLIQEVLF